MSSLSSAFWRNETIIQGDHLSGKPGNVGEFDSCQGNVRDFNVFILMFVICFFLF